MSAVSAYRIELLVAVSGDDILRGTIADPCLCAVALAVTRAAAQVIQLCEAGAPVSVTPEHVTVYDAGYRRWLGNMPREGRELIKLFDGGYLLGGGPHTFELTLERT